MTAETTRTTQTNETAMHEAIDRAAETVGAVWPLHSFVTANPLAGFEDRPFSEAVRQARRIFGGRGYPEAEVFERAWQSGRINPVLLEEALRDAGHEMTVEASLEAMRRRKRRPESSRRREAGEDRLDAIMSKWLAAFLDEGSANWSMPNREAGFFAAFRRVARWDREIPGAEGFARWPDEAGEVIAELVAEVPSNGWERLFRYHLTALPGWTGLIRQRAADEGLWQQAHPISLEEYLAARLATADAMGLPLEPPTDWAMADDRRECAREPLEEAWLSAWEATYRQGLLDALVSEGAADESRGGGGEPAAQLVFCIDTRSEIIRRHLEAAGPYETRGYAGFFGVAMRHEGYDAEVPVDACPPILQPGHRIADRPREDRESRRRERDRRSGFWRAAGEWLKSVKSNAATVFSFVESAGSGYGVALAARTLLPESVYDWSESARSRVPADHEFCEPTLEPPESESEEFGAESRQPDGLPVGMSLEAKVECAAGAFELMGWREFAPLVVFVGHGSQTANNPFESSLDCGACAGNPGGPNARVLAAICNEPEVREALADRGIAIPEETRFLAGQHNTTTDRVEVFAGDLPPERHDELEQLRDSLARARSAAAAERVEAMGDVSGLDRSRSVRETERRAADWAETRPEWGLAGNAAFIIGPRERTADLNLGGRSFLHCYDWRLDPDGEALEAIMAGPMVVTQWINNQYYFAGVDNAVWGSGSKITQNPVGNVGVYQGNGGDLMTGLPLQSLRATDERPHHQPLRLTAVIRAPVDRVTDILRRHDALTGLLDNGWMSLAVVDPEQGDRCYRYDGALRWKPPREGRPGSDSGRNDSDGRTGASPDLAYS